MNIKETAIFVARFIDEKKRKTLKLLTLTASLLYAIILSSAL
ncbi:hypothetical protein Dip510_001957 [Elusimicrobium posterum]